MFQMCHSVDLVLHGLVLRYQIVMYKYAVFHA